MCTVRKEKNADKRDQIERLNRLDVSCTVLMERQDNPDIRWKNLKKDRPGTCF
jgi:hypothetical protein